MNRTKLLLTLPILALPISVPAAPPAPLPPPSAYVLDDALLPPATRQARGGDFDTLYWGGVDEAAGTAVPGGVWDFEREAGESDPLQGWTSVDLGDEGLFVRRVTAIDFVGDPAVAVMIDDGSTASLWWGAHESETLAGCWPGGQGYSNRWEQLASRSYPYSGSGSITIDLDYFTDSEAHYDIAYVYVVNDLGVRSEPLNASINGRFSDGAGYSGSSEEGSAIGSPAAPAHDSIQVPEAVLPAGAAAFDVIIAFESDAIRSDGLTESSGGNLNSINGPLGVDDVHVVGQALDDLSDFESGPDGWTVFQAPPIGVHMTTAHLDMLDPTLETVDCQCPLADHVLLAADLDGDPHPEGQFERLVSPPAYVQGLVFPSSATRVELDLFHTNAPGIGHRIGAHYYPWICPRTSLPGWSIVPRFVGSGGYFVTQSEVCERFEIELPDLDGVDSLKIVLDLLADCDLSPGSCDPEDRNPTPYWDNIRLARVTSSQLVDASVMKADLLYQDAFPVANTINPGEPIDVSSFYDLNRGDGDLTNAMLGDSATILGTNETNAEFYLNFRVYAGPQTDTDDPWFARFGGNFAMPGGEWAEVRMDTAEVSGTVVPPTYATYPWPNGAEAADKIIPDGVLTPGASVEYFFSSRFSHMPDERRTLPDTTGGRYFEFEALPGYLETPNELSAPCLLYVDAFGAGAQGPIEDSGLRAVLGQAVDVRGIVHDLWDRYDYLAAGTNVAAPLARELRGDNGMTSYQARHYRTILFNTGESRTAVRDGDAALLTSFLTRLEGPRSLWLSGDAMAAMLSNSAHPSNLELLGNVCNATNVGSFSGLCVPLVPSPGAAFGQGVPSSIGSGCPTLELSAFGVSGTGNGDRHYVGQGGAETPFASVSNDRFAPEHPEDYASVIDGFSLHHLTVTEAACGADRSAIAGRVADVLTFLCHSTGETCSAFDPTGSGDAPGAPITFSRLYRNVPNPFNPRTTVRFDLAARAHVSLEIFDIAGRRVRVLTGGVLPAGHHRHQWDGTDAAGRALASGVYWARLATSEGFVASTRLVLLE